MKKRFTADYTKRTKERKNPIMSKIENIEENKLNVHK